MRTPPNTINSRKTMPTNPLVERRLRIEERIRKNIFLLTVISDKYTMLRISKKREYKQIKPFIICNQTGAHPVFYILEYRLHSPYEALIMAQHRTVKSSHARVSY